MDMKKEFVPYEQSLELKELGFNELCASYFAEKTLMSTIRAVRQDFFILQDFLAAPLYQQAFRFFREKYNFHYSIGVTNICVYHIPVDNYHTTFMIQDSKTYQESELECINKFIAHAKQINKNEKKTITNYRKEK